MKLPYGFTKEEIKEIVRKWDKFHLQVSNGCFPFDEMDISDVYEDDEYIDRYVWIDDAEFCITTSKWDNGKRVDELYLSENIYLDRDGSCEPFYINELRKMVG